MTAFPVLVERLPLFFGKADDRRELGLFMR